MSSADIFIKQATTDNQAFSAEYVFLFRVVQFTPSVQGVPGYKTITGTTPAPTFLFPIYGLIQQATN